jgi:hypothetical protein
MAKRRHFWVVREARYPFHVIVSPSALIVRRGYNGGDWHNRNDTHRHLCHRFFHACTGLKLKPGEGPVKVRIKGIEVLK